MLADTPVPVGETWARPHMPLSALAHADERVPGRKVAADHGQAEVEAILAGTWKCGRGRLDTPGGERSMPPSGVLMTGYGPVS